MVKNKNYFSQGREPMSNQNESNVSDLFGNVDDDYERWLKFEVDSLDACKEILDTDETSIDGIRYAYRHALWNNNTDNWELQHRLERYCKLFPSEMKSLAEDRWNSKFARKTELVKQAYEFYCKHLGEDPTEGIAETEESLIAERNERIKSMSGAWCGTPMIRTEQEYEDRIRLLKKHNTLKDKQTE